MNRVVLILALLIGVAACHKDERLSRKDELSGGINGTIHDKSTAAFSQIMPAAGNQEELLFAVGNSFFNQNWVSSPSSTTARDGLGPLFNAKSCSACHFKDGRGKPFSEPGDNSNGFLIRLSIPGEDEHGGPLPDPTYGGQLNDLSLPGIEPEATIIVTYEYINGTYDDGTTYELRKPIYSLSNFNYGPISPDVRLSPRIGQQMIGLGLLEAISESDILALADENDSDGDGISGKPNYVWDIASESILLGRFGWKANQPTLLQQVAGAFQGDLGIKSYLFTTENHTINQPECEGLPDGGPEEIDRDDLEKVVLYSSSLAVPARRNVNDKEVKKGHRLFFELGCAKCHVSNFTTGSNHSLTYLNNQEIHPYTDLLLHDLGDELSDNRPDYKASGNEWRTQPLWGLGLIQTVNGHTNLLHDGRARSIEEAILWHGGEAEQSTNKFKALSADERGQIIAFLNSL